MQLIEEAVKPGVDVWIVFSVRETAEFDLRSYNIKMAHLCTPSNGRLRFLRQLPPPP